ncbi:MAG: hypothetical protein HY429_01800 [Candidatus Levybacteria bacterium]|nr:hypothetical protein [Candidatus Levybacteria bacterium]
METTVNEVGKLPQFVPGRVLRETKNFRVVMDWKPGEEEKTGAERFFIEPKNKDAEFMLRLAALTHNLKDTHFNQRKVLVMGEEKKTFWEFGCLRADFKAANLPVLLKGKVEIPKSTNEDTIPSPDRMEDCLVLHPRRYTFNELVRI